MYTMLILLSYVITLVFLFFISKPVFSFILALKNARQTPLYDVQDSEPEFVAPDYPYSTPQMPDYPVEVPDNSLINPEFLAKQDSFDEKIEALERELRAGVLYPEDHSEIDQMYVKKPEREYAE